MAIHAVKYQYRGCEISVEVMNISWNKGFWEGRAYVNYTKDGVARTESCFGGLIPTEVRKRPSSKFWKKQSYGWTEIFLNVREWPCNT